MGFLIPGHISELPKRLSIAKSHATPLKLWHPTSDTTNSANKYLNLPLNGSHPKTFSFNVDTERSCRIFQLNCNYTRNQTQCCMLIHFIWHLSHNLTVHNQQKRRTCFYFLKGLYILWCDYCNLSPWPLSYAQKFLMWRSIAVKVVKPTWEMQW